MESLTFLTVDDQPISIEEAVKYLQSAGKLNQFIGDILRQYVIEQEILSREDIDINPALAEQTIIDFRLKNQLTDAQVFQEWLKKNGKDYQTFHATVAFSFKLEKLKSVITEPKLPEYFIQRKIYLDRVVLSRIIVDNLELAEELKTQIEEGGSFEQLAREYSLADDRILNGMMGPISRGTMPDLLRAALDVANPGELIGPIELTSLGESKLDETSVPREERYGLFRAEEFLPASLEDNQLQQALQNELFEKWLAEKIQTLRVKLQVK